MLSKRMFEFNPLAHSFAEVPKHRQKLEGAASLSQQLLCYSLSYSRYESPYMPPVSII